MDNLCHTLVGAALAESGLKRRTALGTWTLVLGANLPDLDVLAIPFGHGIDFRRGATHGIVALFVLPVVLAWAMAFVHRRRGRRFGEPPFRLHWAMVLAAIAVASHPLLDWMNTYGVRWLAPLDGTWYSAESLFIVDLFLWVVLGVGVILGRRLRRRGAKRPDRPARIALGAAVAYIALMIGASQWTRAEARRELAARGSRPERLVVSPRPASVLSRDVIHERDGVYRFARAALFSDPMLAVIEDSIPRNTGRPEARAAAATALGRQFLTWSRLPYYDVSRAGDLAKVRLDDARYSRGEPSWAAVYVELRLGPDGWRATNSRPLIPR